MAGAGRGPSRAAAGTTGTSECSWEGTPINYTHRGDIDTYISRSWIIESPVTVA